MKRMKLILDDTKNSLDLLYKTNFKVPDPVIFFEIRNKKYLVLNDLEFERGIRQATVDHVLSLRSISSSIKSNDTIDIIKFLLNKYKIEEVEVPYTFPSFIFNELKKLNIPLFPSSSPIFYSSRQIKEDKEVRLISKTMKSTEKVMKLIIDRIKSSKAKNKYLFYGGKILTSESLRSYCKKELAALGLECPDCIIASGKHSALPHHEGTGPIKEHQPIVMDIFPRDLENGYYADITRTVCKGKAPENLKTMFNVVLKGQKLGLSLVKARIKSKTVHNRIFNFFEESGFHTNFEKKQPEGFIHSTGHGLGLEIHEAPRVSSGEDLLRDHQVITVEPGLYYPRLGGIRIEDTILVTKQGYKNLTNFPKFFEI